MLGSTGKLLQVHAVVNGFDSPLTAWYPQSTADISSRLPAACSLGCEDMRPVLTDCEWNSQAVSAFQPPFHTQNAFTAIFSLLFPTLGVVDPLPSSWKWATSEGALLSSHLVKKQSTSWKVLCPNKKKNADKLFQKQRHWNQLLLLQQSRKSQWEKGGFYGSPLRKMWGRLPFRWRIQG